jgi:superfamily II DNA helicase RecQ
MTVSEQRGDFREQLRWGHRFRQNLERMALLLRCFQQILRISFNRSQHNSSARAAELVSPNTGRRYGLGAAERCKSSVNKHHRPSNETRRW